MSTVKSALDLPGNDDAAAPIFERNRAEEMDLLKRFWHHAMKVWKVVFGGVLCQGPIGAVFVVGWTLRLAPVIAHSFGSRSVYITEYAKGHVFR